MLYRSCWKRPPSEVIFRAIKYIGPTDKNHPERCLLAVATSTPRPRCISIGPAGLGRGALLSAPLTLLPDVARRAAKRARDEALWNVHLLLSELLDKRHGVRLSHALAAEQLNEPLQDLRVDTEPTLRKGATRSHRATCPIAVRLVRRLSVKRISLANEFIRLQGFTVSHVARDDLFVRHIVWERPLLLHLLQHIEGPSDGPIHHAGRDEARVRLLVRLEAEAKRDTLRDFDGLVELALPAKALDHHRQSEVRRLHAVLDHLVVEPVAHLEVVARGAPVKDRVVDNHVRGETRAARGLHHGYRLVDVTHHAEALHDRAVGDAVRLDGEVLLHATENLGALVHLARPGVRVDERVHGDEVRRDALRLHVLEGLPSSARVPRDRKALDERRVDHRVQRVLSLDGCEKFR